MKRVRPDIIRKHRIELIVESNDSHFDVTDLVLDSVWENLDKPHENVYIVHSEEVESIS